MFKKVVMFIVFIVLVTCLYGCGKSDVYSGYWFNKEDSEYAKIEKNSEGYTWTDDDGKYSAKIEENKLIVDGGGLKATVTYDEEDEVLRVTVLGVQIEYKRVSEKEYEKNMSKSSD